MHGLFHFMKQETQVKTRATEITHSTNISSIKKNQTKLWDGRRSAVEEVKVAVAVAEETKTTDQCFFSISCCL